VDAFLRGGAQPEPLIEACDLCGVDVAHGARHMCPQYVAGRGMRRSDDAGGRKKRAGRSKAKGSGDRDGASLGEIA